MCRSIKTLFNFKPPATEDEIRAASLQFVRKISGYQKPSHANEAAFDAAVDAGRRAPRTSCSIRWRPAPSRATARSKPHAPAPGPPRGSARPELAGRACPDGEAAGLFVCAHGAGGHMADRGMTRAAQALRGAGFDVVRFNFPVPRKGLEATRSDAGAEGRASPRWLRERARSSSPASSSSAGARWADAPPRCSPPTASNATGFCCLPIPCTRPGSRRSCATRICPRSGVPVLCFNGTRDELCRRDLMEAVLAKLSWQMHWLEGAGHSFRVKDLKEIAAV